MRFPIGLTRLPLPQFTWGSIDQQVETPQPAAAADIAVNNTTEPTTTEGNNE